MGEYILAIDQGTTGSTVLVFDHDVGIRGRACSELTPHWARPAWVEHDAAEIWKVTGAVVAEALKNIGIRASDRRPIRHRHPSPLPFVNAEK
jgi:glycerol kinase